MAATAVVTNCPSLLELAVALAYAEREDFPPIYVTIAYKIEGRDGTYERQMKVTSLRHKENSGGAIEFSGRIVRFDGDTAEKVQGTLFPEHRHGQLKLEESSLIPEIL